MQKSIEDCCKNVYRELDALEEAIRDPEVDSAGLAKRAAASISSIRAGLEALVECGQRLSQEFAEKEDMLAIDSESIEILDAFAEDLATEKSALESKNLELAYLADHDALTGLHNRRFIEEAVKHEIDRSKRFGVGLAAVMIDLDYFKRINDTYGHLAGDAVLRALAEVVTANLRKVDIIGRYGGEEFLALLPESNEQTVGFVVKRLQSAIRAMEVAHGDSTIQVTASFGIAVLNPTDSGERSSDLVLRADQALYHAKESGRNRYEIWNESLLKSPRMPNVKRVPE